MQDVVPAPHIGVLKGVLSLDPHHMRTPLIGLRLHPSRAGLTAIELSIMVTIFLLGLLAFSRSVRGSVDLGATSRESTLATEAVRAVIERMQGQDFADVHALYNADPDDDPDGVGTAPGATFVLEGLDVRTDDADGFAGVIEFPTANGFDLREDVGSTALGMPRDLNLDGVVDGVDHSADYRILPVLVRVEWRGSTGDRALSFKTILTER